MELDKYGNATLVNRDTGKDHVCNSVSAKEILAATGTDAADGGPLYVDKASWDGKVAGAKGDKPKKVEAPEPAPSLA